MTRQKPRPSPYAWLWAELERRFGVEVAAEIKAGYLEEMRKYTRSIWRPHDVPPPK